MSEPDTLFVLAAAYDDRAAAEADYEAVKALYYEVETLVPHFSGSISPPIWRADERALRACWSR